MKDDDIWTLFLFQWEASCTKTEGLASDNRFFISIKKHLVCLQILLSFS